MPILFFANYDRNHCSREEKCDGKTHLIPFLYILVKSCDSTAFVFRRGEFLFRASFFASFFFHLFFPPKKTPALSSVTVYPLYSERTLLEGTKCLTFRSFLSFLVSMILTDEQVCRVINRNMYKRRGDNVKPIGYVFFFSLSNITLFARRGSETYLHIREFDFSRLISNINRNSIFLNCNF